jgi:hypothetical protein
MIVRALCIVACLLAACGAGDLDATAVAISVKTDLPPEQLREVVYRVFPYEAQPATDPSLYDLTVPAEELDRPFVVVRGKDDRFLISVEGYVTPGGEPVVVYQARVQFERGRTLALRVFLASACYRFNCGFPGLICYGETYGTVRGGTCGAVPMPSLPRVSTPGDESDWMPMPVPAPRLDAGLPGFFRDAALPGFSRDR